MSYRIGTVCHIGQFNEQKQTFEQFKDCKMGTVTRESMLKICGISKQPELLTDELVTQHFVKLQAKLEPKVKQNLQALRSQLSHVATYDDVMKLFRISSDLLPLYDHSILGKLYDQRLESIIDASLAVCKLIIDTYNIRVCTHPDQYCVINSDREHVRTNSYRTLYMHKRFMEKLIDSRTTSINVHLNGNLDHLPEVDQDLHSDLIPWLSFENEDKRGKIFVAGTLQTLEVCERYNIKMLLDLHHHLCLEGDQISINEDLIRRICNTWQGERPLMHLSQGRDSFTDKRHSDMITDTDLIAYAADFLYFADLEIEAKHKGHAVQKFVNGVTQFTQFDD
ncbi:UV-endonuclease [Vibrio phage 1.101.O._10N.261.45.C6]|nr:UV-endonuclease [Vibrio phage 1.101.O._10N.261.45.C6]